MRFVRIVFKIMPATLLVTAFSTLVTCVHFLSPVKLAIPSVFITSISMVISLVLVFRTNTAYERYWEGRRLWSSMSVAIRNFARIVWVNGKEDTPEDVILKKSAINMMLAFAVSVKHYLREEFGTEYEDLKYLLKHIPELDTSASMLHSAFQPPPKSRLNLCFPILPSYKNYYEARRTHTNILGQPFLNKLPLEITLYLSSYLQHQRNRDKLDLPSTSNGLVALGQLTECLTGLERIRCSPIPFAYTVHLIVSLWIYLLALPFQLLSTVHWITIPICAIAAFILLGIESIGAEIENPFGYDINDLPLDEYCEMIKLELDNVTSRPSPANSKLLLAHYD
ncbi:uncharacterized protein VTP21DRAFT_4938 [Calcarisporiella thermophila]|uniref:uncharacterized protein n=1 Tax=Calcarisporiella thermophila TaxID=911321 RepID=UPI0037429E7C